MGAMVAKTMDWAPSLLAQFFAFSVSDFVALSLIPKEDLSIAVDRHSFVGVFEQRCP